MLYIILIIIAIFLYKIYKGQKPKVLMSKEETMENIQTEIKEKEDKLLNKIKTNRLKDYMQTETIMFDCGRKNFLRLSERFKHDGVKFAQIVKDWMDYIEAVSDIIFVNEMLDVCTSKEANGYYKQQDELFIKIQEIEKRYKNLLGDKYIDPSKLINDEKDKTKDIEEYNDMGNLIHLKSFDGSIENWREYNEKGQEIHFKDKKGYEYWKKYNDDGEVIYCKDSDGVVRINKTL